MKVTLGRGSVVVSFPPQELMSGLSRFRHAKNGDGEYEELYTLSTRQSLVTMPGFAKRVVGLCPEHRVRDERIPLPEPDVESALHGVPEVFHDVVRKALKADGGVVCIPEIFGTAGFASAIARAFPRDRLAERGTPLTVVAAKDNDVRNVVLGMRKLLPDRKVAMGDCSGDDIIVATYGMIKECPILDIGILIGDDVACDSSDPGKTIVKRAECVSSLRNAARWGVYSTACGGAPDNLDLAAEGLFGPIAASVGYKDAVKAGIAAPVTVCWLTAPRPNAQWGSAPFKTLSSLAMGDLFVNMVAEIAWRTPSDVGCIVCSDAKVQQKLLKAMDGAPSLVAVCKKTAVKDQRVAFGNIESGGVSRALVTWDAFPPATCQGVMVAATCGGRDFAGAKFPWRSMESENKVYIVDFSHGWDVHNGRPGVIARNDEARKIRYAELGFSQMSISCIDQLPFIG